LKLFYNVKYCKQKSVTNDPIAETLETDMIKCLEHDIVKKILLNLIEYKDFSMGHDQHFC
jgi:hypothetical protein